MQYALGRVEELGFAVDPIRVKTGAYFSGMINSSGYPTLIASYHLPVMANCTNTASPYSPSAPGCTFPPGGFLTWPQMTGTALEPFWLTGSNYTGSVAPLPTEFANQLQANDSYDIYPMAGLAMMVDHNDPGAAQAWSWYLPNVYNAIPAGYKQSGPQWFIVPRTDTNTLPAQPTATPSSAGAT
jgi:hypothetical protein